MRTFSATPLFAALLISGIALAAPPGDNTFSAQAFNTVVKTLSGDDFQGRSPGTPGEAKTIAYLQSQFENIGLKPGNRGSWFQTVPMIASRTAPDTSLTLTINGKPHVLALGQDMTIGTKTGKETISIKHSPLVFVGYGVDAPEHQWNDYAGVDVKGKTVVMFVNDPGFHTGDDTLFEGPRMTWYGRWAYKFEEAARKGAAAALIVHDDAGAAYGWSVLRNGAAGESFALLPQDDPAARVPAQGWITGAQAKALFAEAGLDIDTLRKQASTRGFKAMPLPATLDLELHSTVRRGESKNVIGILPGTERPDEAVVYMAHWDHLGMHADEPGDNIYRGAVDNGTGIAGMLGIADAFARAPQPPKRSLVFAAVTLEEATMLGSQYYVAHPATPLDKTVAVINLDAMVPIGKARDVTVIGRGSSQLEDLLADALRTQDRVLADEPTPQDGFYFRSDHFSFAKAGVPALYIRSGTDLVKGGSAAGVAAVQDYVDHRYHKPADRFDPDWDVSGILQDMQAMYTVGRVLADGDAWPQWNAGNAFREAQQRLRKQDAPAR